MFDEILFQKWVSQEGLSDGEASYVRQKLEEIENPNSMVSFAIRKRVSYDFMLRYIEKDVLPAVRKRPGVVQQPRTVSTVESENNEDDLESESFLDRMRERFELSFPSKKVLIGVGIGLIVIVLMIILAFSYFGKRPTSSVNFQIVEPTAVFSQNLPTVVPENAFSVTPEFISPSNEVDNWGTVNTVAEISENNGREKRELFSFRMNVPETLVSLFKEPNWNFLVMMIVLVFMFIIVKTERFAEQQKTDWRVIRVGILLVISGLVLKDVFAFLLTKIGWFLFELSPGSGFIFDPIWVTITFVGMGIVAFVNASMTGKADWTPLSVGLFSTGVMILAFFPEAPGIYIGYAMIVLGIIVHVFELGSQQGTAGALGIALLGLILFLGFRFGLEALFNLIGNANLPIGDDFGSNTIRWFALGAYELRSLWSTLISLLVGFVLASLLATVIFPPIANMLPQGGYTSGVLSPTEETPRNDAIVAYLMVIVCYWLISGQF